MEPDTLSDMPGTPEEVELLATIMARHDVAQADLVRESGLDSAYVSRICSGQHPITLVLVRALYRLTEDWALHDFIFGALVEESERRRRVQEASAVLGAAALQVAHDPTPARLAALASAQTKVNLAQASLERGARAEAAKRSDTRRKARLPKEGVLA